MVRWTDNGETNTDEHKWKDRQMKREKDRENANESFSCFCWYKDGLVSSHIDRVDKTLPSSLTDSPCEP